MEKCVLFVCYFALLSAAAPNTPYPRVTKQYRSDYVYNRDTDAFYKLHIEGLPHLTITSVCQVEGAELMSPSSEKDLLQLHAMFTKYPDLGEYVWVADDDQQHESTEETPIIDLNPTSESQERMRLQEKSNCVAVSRDGAVETISCYRRDITPFICKVKATDAPYDDRCGVFGRDYKYFESVSSCYKIPRIDYTWSEAFSECEAEDAHLVVLNSETEGEVVQNLTLTEASLQGARTDYFFFAGFRADRPGSNETTESPRVFRTIFNQTLEQAGFSGWGENEPNNALGNEYCGSIFRNDGKLNDVDCTHRYAFICEKEVRRR